MVKYISSVLTAILTIALWTGTPFAETTDYSQVSVNAVQLSQTVHMLTGGGGNMAVCTGQDGAFLVDDQFAPLTEKIRTAIKGFYTGDIRFLVNTHWHYDHVGGNENLAKAGTVIFAHENVRKRMATDQFMAFFQQKVPAATQAALPVVTFTSDVAFHVNGEHIRVFHIENAHTDGDAVVHFTTSNILHTGDIYFEGLYPFIDTGAHGSIDGMIRAVDRLLPLVDEHTRIIPGHGPLSNKEKLTAYRNMLAAVRNKVAPMIEAGMSLADIQAARPTAPFDEKWGKGFLSPDKFVHLVVESLSGSKPDDGNQHNH